MSTIFNDFDFAKFWDNSDYAKAEYIGRPSTLEMIRAAEKELGYTLPKSYIEFVTHQNGGTPKLSNHRTAEATSWASDHVAIHGIYGVDSNLSYSLTGSTGYKNWIGNWGYPDIGIYFADCPSAGHDMICLDYSECGPHGEPRVVHVDQEFDYKITFVAESFEAFIRGLESDEEFEITEE